MLMHRRREQSFASPETGKQICMPHIARMAHNKRNTPVIIKYPFWQYTAANKNAFYACINKGEAYCPEEIAKRSMCIDGDIGEVLKSL